MAPTPVAEPLGRRPAGRARVAPPCGAAGALPFGDGATRGEEAARLCGAPPTARAPLETSFRGRGDAGAARCGRPRKLSHPGASLGPTQTGAGAVRGPAGAVRGPAGAVRGPPGPRTRICL